MFSEASFSPSIHFKKALSNFFSFYSIERVYCHVLWFSVNGKRTSKSSQLQKHNHIWSSVLLQGLFKDCWITNRVCILTIKSTMRLKNYFSFSHSFAWFKSRALWWKMSSLCIINYWECIALWWQHHVTTQNTGKCQESFYKLVRSNFTEQENHVHTDYPSVSANAAVAVKFKLSRIHKPSRKTLWSWRQVNLFHCKSKNTTWCALTMKQLPLSVNRRQNRRLTDF